MEHSSGPQAIDVLIPALNEEEALPHVLGELDKRRLRRVVVVDNGSTDGTARVAREHGAEVVSCPRPGYGRACLAGLAYMAQDPPDIVVFLDGDRSDDPAHLPLLVDPILEGRYDFVLGSRTMGQAEKGSLNMAQRFGNGLATGLMKVFWRAAYTDLGPFRAIRWDSLARIGMTDQDFGWTIEMQIKAWRLGLRILEAPVSYRRRIGISKISGTLNGVVRAGSKILFTIFKYKFGSGARMGPVEKRKVRP